MMAKDRCRLTRSTGRTEHKPVAGKADTRPIIGLTSGRFLSIGKKIPKTTVRAVTPRFLITRGAFQPKPARLFASKPRIWQPNLLIFRFGSDKLSHVPRNGDRDEMGF